MLPSLGSTANYLQSYISRLATNQFSRHASQLPVTVRCALFRLLMQSRMRCVTPLYFKSNCLKSKRSWCLYLPEEALEDAEYCEYKHLQKERHHKSGVVRLLHLAALRYLHHVAPNSSNAAPRNDPTATQTSFWVHFAVRRGAGKRGRGAAAKVLGRVRIFDILSPGKI